MDDKKKKKDTKARKEFDPKKYVNVEPRLNEAAKKDSVVISFVRMNPITVGHEKLVNMVLQVAAKEKSPANIFVSHTNDPKKNPLTYDQKIKYGQLAFGNVITRSKSKTIIQVAADLQSKYKNLIVVSGSDRVAEFDTLLNKYNGKDYTFDSIKVVSAGERDPDAEGVAGMSASKMRQAVIDNDFEEFKKGLPKKLQTSADELFKAIRDGMKLSEEVIYEALNNQQRKARAILMRRLAPKIKRGRERAARKKAPLEKLKGRARKQAIGTMKDKFAKGKSYSELGYAQRQAIDDRIKKMPANKLKNIERKLLPSIKAKERDKFKQKKESVNMAFESFLLERNLSEGCMDISKVMKRPHLLLTKDGSVKYDKRFKMYKTKNKEIADIIDKEQEVCESSGDLVLNFKDIFDLKEAVGDYLGESLDEAVNKQSPLYKEYQDLKAKSVKDLKRIYQQNNRLDTGGMDLGGKADIIATIMYDKHSTKRVKELYNESLDESLDEAKKIGSKVQITKGPHKGKTGYIRSVKKGEYGNPTARKFDIDLEDGKQTVEYTKDVKEIKKSLEEAKKPGLWANIRAKRKRGEKPAKPGEKGYPKTLDIEEELVEGSIEERAFDGAFKFYAPKIAKFLDKTVNKKDYEKAIKTLIDMTKKNPDQQSRNVVKAAGVWNVDTKILRDIFDDMNTQSEEGGAGDYGTDKARKKFQKDTPNEDCGKKKSYKDLKESLPKLSEVSDWNKPYTYNARSKERNAGEDKGRAKPTDKGTFQLTINGKTLNAKDGKPMTWSNLASATKAAQTMMTKPFNKDKKFQAVRINEAKLNQVGTVMVTVKKGSKTREIAKKYISKYQDMGWTLED